jgi:MoxR-like ATPase
MPFFSRQSTNPRPEPRRLPGAVQLEATQPEHYLADDGLVDAVNTALLLSQPLLLTGEPGTGKTQLANALSYQLGYPAPLRFEAKSTSEARDLFYTYDAVRHYRAESTASPLEFIRYAALGKAVLLANPPDRVRHLLPQGMQHDAPTPSVVLIDEVDKAPRDFPNDILVELEELSFRIPELSAAVQAPPGMRPVVVITSNSERDLPDAFLRRCVYYDIPFPERPALEEILVRRLRRPDQQPENPDFIQTALSLFDDLRKLPDLRKKPATAELIAWVAALRRAYPEADNPLAEPRARVEKLSVLIKTREDRKVALRALDGSPPSRI